MSVSKKDRLAEIINDLRRFRFCGPSDDGDEQTAVTTGYRNLLVQLKRLATPFLPGALAAQLDTIEVDVHDIYSAYEARAELDALMPDIEVVLDRSDDRGVKDAAMATAFSPKEVEQALRDYDHSAADLLNSNHDTFVNNLRRFLFVLRDNSVFKSVLAEELPAVDFSAWYADATTTVSGMVGSGTLNWPIERPKRLALQKALLNSIGQGTESVPGFCNKFMYSGNQFDSMVDEVNRQIVEPFMRDVRLLVEDRADDTPTELGATPSKVGRLSATDATDISDDTRQEILTLFVSHSSKDRAIVKLLADLLRSALRLSAKELRCTSVDGYRLPGGADTIEQLRREVHDAQAFIGVISPASLESTYVTFELGARWGAAKPLIPILTPGTDASSLSGPLSGMNALRSDNAAQLHQLISDLAIQLGIDVEPASVYQGQIDEIISFAHTQQAAAASDATATSENEANDSVISELSFSVLIVVGKQERATVSDVASAVDVSEEKAKFYLDDLSRRHRLIDWIGNMNPSIPGCYMLNHDGRRLLVDRGVFL